MTQKPRKGDFRKLKSKKFHCGASPGPLLEACALDARLQNRSVFILDPRMSIPHLLFTENGYRSSPPRLPGSFGWTSVAYDCLMFALNTIDQSQLTLVHLNHLRSHCTQSLSLFSLECLRWGITEPTMVRARGENKKYIHMFKLSSASVNAKRLTCF